MLASDLIGAAKARTKRNAVPQNLLIELRKVCEHNDSARADEKVHESAAREMLIVGGVECASFNTLNKICREQLGRTSWAKP